MGSIHHGTDANTGAYGGVFRLRLDSRTRYRIRDRETREMLEDYTGLLIVGLVCTIVIIQWFAIDQEEFNRKFERMKKAAEEEN